MSTLLEAEPEANLAAPLPIQVAGAEAIHSAEPRGQPPFKTRKIGFAFAGIALAQGTMPAADYGTYLDEL